MNEVSSWGSKRIYRAGEQCWRITVTSVHQPSLMSKQTPPSTASLHIYLVHRDVAEWASTKLWGTESPLAAADLSRKVQPCISEAWKNKLFTFQLFCTSTRHSRTLPDSFGIQSPQRSWKFHTVMCVNEAQPELKIVHFVAQCTNVRNILGIDGRRLHWWWWISSTMKACNDNNVAVMYNKLEDILLLRWKIWYCH